MFSENAKLLFEMYETAQFMGEIRGYTGRLDEDTGAINPNPNIGLDDGFTWIRPLGERNAIAVLNNSVRTDRANIPVVCRTTRGGQLYIDRVDTERAISTYGAAIAHDLNRPNKIAENEKGPIQHKRLKDLRLRLDASGGLVLYLDKGIYEKTDTTLENWDGGTIDLTASIPAVEDTKRIILVGLDSSNAIVQSAVTAVDTGTAPTSTPYFTLDAIVTAANAATSTTRWLWAVPAFYAQTEFLNTDDFIDLRPIVYGRGGVYQVTATSPIASSGGTAPNISLTGIVPIANGGTGQSTQTAAFDALAPNTTKGDIVAYNGSDNVRLAVGVSNGMLLSVDSSTATGLAWTGVGATYEATLATSGNTLTTVFSYVVAELVTVTIHGHYTASKTDKSAAAGGSFRATYRRATAGNVALILTGWLEQETDSIGLPTLSVDADVGTQSARVRWTGVAAEDWTVKVQYEVIAY
jgi:hypothetical protein